MTRLLGTLTVLTLFLAACGSDEDDFRDQLKEFDSSITDDTVDCIIAELDARGLSVVDISDEAVGDGPIPAGGPEAFLACLPVDSSGSADSDTSTDLSDSSDTYGNDPTLDALWDSCEAGIGAACDDLYFQSAVGSDYEEFGITCGGRYAISPGSCEDALA